MTFFFNLVPVLTKTRDDEPSLGFNRNVGHNAVLMIKIMHRLAKPNASSW